MKTKFYNTAVQLSIIPVFFFIAGCLSLVRLPEILYKIDFSELFFLFAVLFLASYVFLRDFISVFINISCFINTILGLLFFIDLFEFTTSSLLIIVITVSLSFSLFLNTLLLSGIQQHKKSSDADAKQAVKTTLKQNFWTIVLSFIAIVLLFFWVYLGYQSIEFLLIVTAGLGLAVINAVMLLPIFSSFWLGHLNEEQLQDDDVKLSFSKQQLLNLNNKIEKCITLLVWVISPIVKNKKLSYLLTIFAALYTFSFLQNNSEDFLAAGYSEQYFLLLSGVLFFLFIVIRYQSYILAIGAILSMVFNYLLVLAFFEFIIWDSDSLMEIGFFISMMVVIIGNSLQTESFLQAYKKNENLQDTILNTVITTFYSILAATFGIVIFILFLVYSGVFNAISYQEIGAILLLISFSGMLLLISAPAFLNVFFSLQEYCSKPSKRKIKSIYL